MSEIPATAIGKRVTVRVRDGVGFRDIVGVLQSQSSLINRHGVLVDFSDENVAIWREIQPLADRAGKGAPLSLRIAELEALSNATWPSHVEEKIGGWIYRRSNGVTWRANSVLPVGKVPFGEPESSIEKEVEKVIGFYKLAGLTPAFTIPLPIYSELDLFLNENGWKEIIKAKYLIKDISLQEKVSAEVKVEDESSKHWLACQGDEKIQGIMNSFPSKYLSILEGDEVIATARVATLGTWSLVTRLFVKEEFRSRGLARKIMNSAEATARGCGATKIALQVDVTNTGALVLYESLGYELHHEYLYRVSP